MKKLIASAAFLASASLMTAGSAFAGCCPTCKPCKVIVPEVVHATVVETVRTVIEPVYVEKVVVKKVIVDRVVIEPVYHERTVEQVVIKEVPVPVMPVCTSGC